ncbi:MAG: phosphate acyltransferase, partial [Bacteroidia bacterium]|nr:phosphate acyltransferase [Bacteroidia bacterium]
MIRTFDQMEKEVLTLQKKHRIAVAWAQDTNTIGAIHKAVSKGFIEAILIGKSSEIIKTCKAEGINDKLFTIIETD